MACNAPSYPPPSSGGGWGNSWGESWSSGGGGSGTWDVTMCIDISYTVTPTLTITYEVPVILDIDYDVKYGFPLTIEYSVPPPLTIKYTVAKQLDISYDVKYGFPLTIEFYVSQPLTINYEVSETFKLDISYDVKYGYGLLVGYEVGQNLTVEYRVPDAYKYLDISFDVDPKAKALVVDYAVDASYRTFISYDVIPSTYSDVLTIWYTAVPTSVSLPLNVYYSVESSSTSGSHVIGSDVSAGLVGLSVNASEGAINISARVLPSHAWSSVSPGDLVSGYIGNRIFTFKVNSISYDTESCIYSISGRTTVSNLLDTVIDVDNAAIWVPDPVRVMIDATGYICVSDLDIRNSVDRPTVESAIHAAASAAGIDIELDSGIPGLDDSVPFDMFYDRSELTVADVINSLIGWARPYYFLRGNKVVIVGGHPSSAVGTPPATGDFNSRTEKLYELPRSVKVSGGPWPDEPHESNPSGDNCGGATDPEPSEARNYTLHEVTTNSENSSSIGNVLGRTVEKTVNKSSGKVVSESEYVYIDYLKPDLVGNDIVGYSKTRALAEYTLVTYSYLGGCKDALSKKISRTYRTSASLVEGPLEAAIYVGYGLTDTPILYRLVEEEWGWGRKAYVEKYTKTETVANQIVGNSVTYRVDLTTERWLPFGDGLWYHSRSYTKRRALIFQPIGDPVNINNPSNYRQLLHSSQETDTEITDSGPMTSSCLIPPSDCGSRCESTSSSGDGLTRYQETVSIGGDDKAISISVPGINSYWPLPAVLPDSGTAPPMNIGSTYANYAARMRRETGRITVDYLMCMGNSGGFTDGVYIDTNFRLPGDIVNGGLVVSSSLKVDSDGKASGSYEVVYFA